MSSPLKKNFGMQHKSLGHSFTEDYGKRRSYIWGKVTNKNKYSKLLEKQSLTITPFFSILGLAWVWQMILNFICFYQILHTTF